MEHGLSVIEGRLGFWDELWFSGKTFISNITIVVWQNDIDLNGLFVPFCKAIWLLFQACLVSTPCEKHGGFRGTSVLFLCFFFFF